MSEYPEHDKLRAVNGVSEDIYRFLSWMDDKTEFRLCREVVLDDPDMDDPTVFLEAGGEDLKKLLAQYFAIDLEELDAEKQQMIEEL
ncbi:hypothetical protein [Streptomyces sp. UNOC14_S4]|uniref:hypothetical protein n=1 Tax=Streptomyces sp. UNOC14_S4 TaxID=2872340 RepID=UPI001E588370|nr:hypothetical protein [Streptomyces sp. UNOC14_S4]MCC3766488.1 hypothetical protein [Streptomyces sp. UNOC14_S4]